jgi:glucosamine 6-phosphate synthetase-like amidotransferase/phosphosugar isomerase protein
MRAKLIYEKFTEKSDPVKDMGIGSVTFGELLGRKDIEYQAALDDVKKAEAKFAKVKDEYNEVRKKALNEFVGKKITAFMGKRKKSMHGYSYRDIKEEYTIKVKRTICREYENIFVSDRGTEYRVYPTSKIVVHD